jgi:polysaccharide biosynthesis protein PslG
MALIAVAVAAAGTGLGLLLSSGGGPAPSGPGATSTVPPPRSGPSPPWGFASAWVDYCYRPLQQAPGYVDKAVPLTQGCPAGDTRMTGARQIELTARAGATVDRLPVAWSTVQPTPAASPGAFIWAPTDQRYQAMVNAGIRPVVMAFSSPTWTQRPRWQRPGVCDASHGKSCTFPPSRSHIADWREFLTQLMRRYPLMRALEVWNEPNSARFFAPHPAPQLYVRMLGAARRAAQIAGFHGPLITGGLAPLSNSNAGKMPPARFLARIYELGGRGSFDGIGVHPYPSHPPWIRNMMVNLEQVRQVRDHFGDRATPLWITEVGIGGTSSHDATESVSLFRQGRILVRMYHSIQGTDVRSFMIYTLRELQAEGPRFEPYGVMGANLKPKLAYCYLARELGHRRVC